MQPNDILHALVLHPVSSIAHKEASEPANITSKSSSKKKKTYRQSCKEHAYL